MDLKITVTCDVAGAERTYDLEFREEEITIGSDSGNMIQIPDAQVSDWHARIETRGGSPVIVDLGTAGTTIVDGRPLEPTEERALALDSEIRVASYRLKLGQPQLSLDDTTSERTSMVAMDMVRAILGSISGDEDDPPSLEVLCDGEEGTRVELTEEREYRIGREKTSDLVLKHWSISRRHALIRHSGSETTIIDLGSKNGVLVNEERLSGSRVLVSGDRISIGHTEVRYTVPSKGLFDSMSVEPAPAAPPRRQAPAPVEVPRARKPPKAPETPGWRPPVRQPPPPPRKLERETGIGDHLPTILGILLLGAAAAAAVYLFVIKGS